MSEVINQLKINMYSYLKDLSKDTRIAVRAFNRIVDGYLVDVNLDFLVIRQVATSEIAASVTLVRLESINFVSWELSCKCPN